MSLASVGDNAGVLTVETHPPSGEDYVRLREGAGWSVPDPDDAELALAASTAAAVAVDDGRVVGMGRTLGDGELYWLIVDLLVDPAYRGQGIGKKLVAALETAAHKSRPGARLVLVAAPDVVGWYQEMGFVPAPDTLMEKRA